MFDDLVISSAQPKRTNSVWTVALSTIIQFGIVIVMILIPLIYTEALPKQMLTTFLVAPAPPPPPPPPPAAVQRIVKPVARLIHNGQMMAPTVIPKRSATWESSAASRVESQAGQPVEFWAGSSVAQVRVHRLPPSRKHRFASVAM
jgi:protein TonB